MRRAALLVAFGLLAIMPTGCGQGSDVLLSDAREILGRTIQTTAALKTVRARFDLAYQAAPEPDGPPKPRQEGGWLEADADVTGQRFAVHGAQLDGKNAFEAILAGNAMFTKNTSTGRWSKVTIPAGVGMNPITWFGGGFGAGLGTPDVQTVLAGALADGSIGVQLRGVEDCRTGRCYHTALTVPPDHVWQLAMKLSGMDRMGVGVAEQPPVGDLPAISIELLTDTKTLRLVDAIGSGSVKGSSASLRIQLANHDEPVVIQPPNPALVDDQGGFGFGGAAPPIGPAEPGCTTDGNVTTCVDQVGPVESGCVTTGDTTKCILDQVGSELSPEPSAP